jgi:hypothetical protein
MPRAKRWRFEFDRNSDMHAKLNSRLRNLEETAQRRYGDMIRAITKDAFAALSGAETDAVGQVFKRLVVDRNSFREALAKCTREEAAAVERFNAASAAAGMRIKGRALSKAEASDVTLWPSDIRLAEPWKYQWPT